MRKNREKDFYNACWNEVESKNNNTNNITNIKQRKKKNEIKTKKVLRIVTATIAIIYTIRFILRPDIYPLILYMIEQFFTFK